MKTLFVLLLSSSTLWAAGPCALHQWVTQWPDTNTAVCSQPAFTDISGAVTDAQVPDNITITALASKTLLVGSASLNCPDPAASGCSSCGTITVTGAAVGDPVIVGIPAVTLGSTQFIPTARVTATNTVTVQICEGSTVTNDPAAGTFTAVVVH